MNTRRGFTLVELMIAMGASTTLMVISVGLIHRTMTLHSTARQQDALQHAALRLSRQLRCDLHRAESADIADGKLTLTFPNQPVGSDLTYTVSAGAVLRQQFQESGKTHREAFPFPNCSAIEFAELTDPPRVELTVPRDGLAQGMPPVIVLRLEAVVGRRAKLAIAAGGSP